MFSRRLEKFVDQRTGLPEIRLIIGNQTDDTFTRVDVRWRFRAAEVPPPSPKKPSQKNAKPKATKRSKSGAAKYAGPRRPIQSTIYSLEPLGDGSIPPNEEIAFAIGPQWLNEVLSASDAISSDDYDIAIRVEFADGSDHEDRIVGRELGGWLDKHFAL